MKKYLKLTSSFKTFIARGEARLPIVHRVSDKTLADALATVKYWISYYYDNNMIRSHRYYHAFKKNQKMKTQSGTC